MYVVYYRHSRGKGMRKFKTRKAQQNFIVKAPMTYDITGWN